MAWFVVRSTDPQRIARELQLYDIQTANWQQGLKAATQAGFIFISPEVCGWRFIVGDSLPFAPQEECLALLVDLSLAFDEAQYFGTEDITESHSWARAAKGRLCRAYTFSGEQGAVLWDRGELTQEEKTLSLIFPDSPDSSSVFQIAGYWSLDPTCIEEVECVPSIGLMGRR